MDLLRHLPLFSGLTQEQLELISAGSRITELDKGEILFHQGDPVRGFFFVLRGQMQLSVATADGAEKVVEIVTVRESFGEAVVFEGLRYPVTATALVDTTLLAVSSRAVLDLLDRDPSFARRLLANMASRLRRLIPRRRLPGPLSAWTDTRDIPPVPAESFRDWWDRTEGGTR